VDLTDEIRAAIKNQLTASPKPKSRPNRQRRTTAGLWARPFASSALGVNPEQVEEAQQQLKAHGITAEFDRKTGDCVVTSDKQFREVAKAVGMWTGRDGYQGRDHNGDRIFTGREMVEGRERVERKIARGDYDL